MTTRRAAGSPIRCTLVGVVDRPEFLCFGVGGFGHVDATSALLSALTASRSACISFAGGARPRAPRYGVAISAAADQAERPRCSSSSLFLVANATESPR